MRQLVERTRMRSGGTSILCSYREFKMGSSDARQIRKRTLELLGYLRKNADSLPNYGRRYRAGRCISSAFVESAVNQLIDKCMSGTFSGSPIFSRHTTASVTPPAGRT